MYEALATALVLLLTLLAILFARPYRKLNLPPSPPGAWPIVGHLFLLGKLPHQTLWQLAHKHGSLLFLWLGSVPTVVVSDPAMAKECLRTHDRIFASRPKTLIAKLLLYDSQDVNLAEYGLRWRNLRRICQYELLSARRVEDSKDVRREEVMHMLESIMKEVEGGLSVDVNHHAFSFPQNVITRMVLNENYFASPSEALKFKETTTQHAVLFGQFVLGDFIPSLAWLDIQGHERRMKEEHARLDAILEKILEEHKHRRVLQNVGNLTEQSFIDVLLSIGCDGKSEHLSDDVIKALVLDILLAGIDTTAGAIEWTMAEMLRNPCEYEKVHDELDRVVGRERIVQEEDIPNLAYLICCVKETFRLHPPIPLLLPHESTQLVRLGAYDIPAKTRLVVNAWAIGRDPCSWSNPEEFRPERFLEMERDVRGQDYELLPFGSGRRGCPGILLALGTVHMGVAALLHAFDWSLPNTQDKIDMSERFGLTMPKAVPLHAIATPRLPRHLYMSNHKHNMVDPCPPHPCSSLKLKEAYLSVC